MFQIEDGVPLPAKNQTSGLLSALKEAIAKMTVGQSFVIDCNDNNRSYAAIAAYSCGKKVTCRKLPEDKSKMRVYLIEEAA